MSNAPKSEIHSKAVRLFVDVLDGKHKTIRCGIAPMNFVFGKADRRHCSSATVRRSNTPKIEIHSKAVRLFVCVLA